MVSYGQAHIVYDSSINGHFIGKYCSVFSDTAAVSPFQKVVGNPGLFTPSHGDVINLGVDNKIHWVKFAVVNGSSENKIVMNLAHSIIDDVGLYVVYPDGHIDSTLVKEAMPVDQREFKHQNYIFNLRIAPGDSAVCYLSLKGSKQILVPLSLDNTPSIVYNISITDLISGIYFGIMIGMLLYNLFVYFSVREKSYLHYVHYIVWVTLTQAALQGYGHRFLWSHSVWLTENMVNICGALSGISALYFVKSFLQTRKNVPRLHLILNLIIISYLVSLVLLVFNQRIVSYHLIDMNATLCVLFILYSAFRLYQKKYKPARFFIIAWTLFLVSCCVFVMKDYGLFAYNMITYRFLQVGSAAEVILLSFALADNINILKKEKEESQAEALRIAKENERIIKDQNIVLEAKVSERTEELKSANEDLNIAMNTLKDAQTQLVESEKMASLGQLTAGIAHEINNPINFVTANVSPLKRDIALIIDTLGKFEELALGDEMDQVAKKQKVASLKEDIEYDYLMTEIDYLLKGISEGSERTAEIVKGLRIFSRVDEDDLKKVNIHEGVDSSIIIVNSLLNDKIKIEKHYGDLPLVDCYPGKLNQVFLNIISNGIHAINKHFDGKSGGIISVSTNQLGKDHVQIHIKDNGMGMDEQTAKKIFEPFFTTKDVGEGTGLGLSIVYNIIKKHNGTIEVNSEPGLGAEFVITIPINQ
ncbi:sensor histidine kinase [Taibaiella soli]|nr:7TM diverse intracellular signaling domain-containing protein [Taibaiella soli]